MTDLPSNSKVRKPDTEKPEVVQIAEGKVVVRKRGFFRRVREDFLQAEMTKTRDYLVHSVIIPGVRDLIVNATREGVESMIYGETRGRRHGYSTTPRQRVTYNNPSRAAHQRYSQPNRAPSERVGNDYLLSSRVEAERVVDMLANVCDQYGVVSVADMNELCGLPSTHVDQRWGWTSVQHTRIRQTRDGFLIEMRDAETI